MTAALRGDGHDVLAAREAFPAAPDEVVLTTASEQARILITFDRDFGRMIFKEGWRAPPAVIFLRRRPPSPQEALENVRRVLGGTMPSVTGYFVAIGRQARYHPLPADQ